MKSVFLPLLLLLCCIQTFGKGKEKDSIAALTAQLDSLVSFDESIKYKTGQVELNSEVNLNIPTGYKFMSKSDADKVVYEFWGNPKADNEILGIIVKDSFSLVSTDWALVLTYENSGYVKDDDADKIDYKEMMSEIHKSEIEENKERTKAGYSTIHVIDWAITPYYDKKNNVLHWAKAIQFGNEGDTTLNYDVRVLGRRGLLSMNAVGTMDQLSDIKNHVPDILRMAQFKKGSSYVDFDPGVDKVAAYTIGGLIAGKLLAKAGLFALLLKNIKLILIAAAGGFGVFRKKIAAFFNRNNTVE